MDRHDKPGTSSGASTSTIDPKQKGLTVVELDIEILPIIYEIIRWYVAYTYTTRLQRKTFSIITKFTT